MTLHGHGHRLHGNGHRLTLHVNQYLEDLWGSFKPTGALALAVAALASDTRWTLEHVVIIISTFTIGWLVISIA